MNKTRDRLPNGNNYCHLYKDDIGCDNIHNSETNETYRIVPDPSCLGFHLERFKGGKLIARNSITFKELKILTDLTGQNYLLESLSGHGGEKISKSVTKTTNNHGLPKLLIVGSMRHGKDTFAEILRDKFGYKFESSSEAASRIFIYDKLKDKYGYKTPDECFKDRVNHRAEWYDMICEYNKGNRARLATEILKEADCYVGMRDVEEINECMRQELFDIIIWVDASERLPNEPSDSFNIDKSVAHLIVTNNGTLEEFEKKVIDIGEIMLGLKPVLNYRGEEVLDKYDILPTSKEG